MGNVLFSIIWLIILIFIGFWIAGIAAGIYVILIPFTVCIEPLSVSEFKKKVCFNDTKSFTMIVKTNNGVIL